MMTVDRIEIWCENSAKHLKPHFIVAFYRRGAESPKAAAFRAKYGGFAPPEDTAQWIEEYDYSPATVRATEALHSGDNSKRDAADNLTQVILWGDSTENPLNDPGAPRPRAHYRLRCKRCLDEFPRNRENLTPLLDLLAASGRGRVALADLVVVGRKWDTLRRATEGS